MKSTSKPPRKHGHNVVELPITKQPAAGRPVESFGGAGAPELPPSNDARVKEAMRLAQAFLAIEDAAARSALVALAERLVSFDWVRKMK